MPRPLAALPLIASLLLLSLDAVAQTSHAWNWVVPIGGTNNDHARDVALDDDGNAYVVGVFLETASIGTTSLATNGADDFFIAKVDVDGNVLWAHKAGGSGVDAGQRVCVDDEGNVFALGSFTGSAWFGDDTITGPPLRPTSFVACYSPEGELRWVRAIPASGIGPGLLSIVADGDGSVYAAGLTTTPTTWDSVAVGFGGFILKIDETGRVVWANHLGNIPRNFDFALDERGRLFVTGTFRRDITLEGVTLTSRTDHYTDQFLIGYDSDGSFLFATVLASQLTVPDPIRSIVARDGEVIVTGDFRDTIFFGSTPRTSVPGVPSCYVASYDVDLRRHNWSRSIHPDDNQSGASDLALGPEGRVFMSGTFHDTIDADGTILASKGDADGFIFEIDDTGGIVWAARLGDDVQDSAKAIAFTHTSGFAVAGSIRKSAVPNSIPEVGTLSFFGPGSVGRSDGYLLRLDAGVSGIVDDRSTRTALHLSPNPAASSLTISYTVDAPSTASIELFDALGRSVVSVAPRRCEEGTYSETIDVEGLAPGVYLVRVRIDGGEGEGVVRVGRVAVGR